MRGALNFNGWSCFLRISVSTATIIYAKRIFNRSFAEKYYNLLCNFLWEKFSTYEEFHVKLSEVERTTYSKYSIVKEHKGFSKGSERGEASCLFEML